MSLNMNNDDLVNCMADEMVSEIDNDLIGAYSEYDVVTCADTVNILVNYFGELNVIYSLSRF